jgi:hypothetical protein
VAKEATTTIPIVMAISGDAIATGLVSSLAAATGASARNMKAATARARVQRVRDRNRWPLSLGFRSSSAEI